MTGSGDVLLIASLFLYFFFAFFVIQKKEDTEK